MLKSPIRALQLICTCFNIFGPTKEKILECEKAILKFWDSFVLQKHSYNGPNNAYSDKRVHLPPLFFSTMKVSPPVSDKIKGILHKASVDIFEDSKHAVIDWEEMVQVLWMLNPDARSTPYTVFVSQSPQHQEVQKVQVTKKSTVLKFPFDVEGGLSMEIANGINGELQAHYKNGILVVYLVDDNVGLTLVNAKDLSVSWICMLVHTETKFVVGSFH